MELIVTQSAQQIAFHVASQIHAQYVQLIITMLIVYAIQIAQVTVLHVALYSLATLVIMITIA